MNRESGKLAVTSPAFAHEGLIPIEYTGYGSDISPELRLSGLMDGVKSLAVIMDDMGHPVPAYNHWVIWNIPAANVIAPAIPHGKTVDTPKGAVQGRGYGRHRYRGPYPPFNWKHVYQFNVYALDCMLELPPETRKRALLKAIQGHVLQQGVLLGHYR